jgi:maltose O-acetyltransferase
MKQRFLLAMFRFLPALLVELVARIVAYGVNLFRPGWAYPAERAVRGRYWSLIFFSRGLKVGRGVQFEGSHLISLGSRARVNDNCQIIAGTKGFVSIGEDTHLARFSLVAGGGGVTIGDRCMISSFVAIYSSGNDLTAEIPAIAPAVNKPVVLGDDVFVGVGAKVLPGVTIGNSAVIGAGAVVVQDVAPGQKVVGIPAKPVSDSVS